MGWGLGVFLIALVLVGYGFASAIDKSDGLDKAGGLGSKPIVTAPTTSATAIPVATPTPGVPLDPAQVVLASNDSMRTLNCAAFKKTVTTAYLESLYDPDKFKCSQWQDDYSSETVDGTYEVKVTVTSAYANPASTEATVKTVEVDSSADPTTTDVWTYSLIKQNGVWAIDDEESPTAGN